MRAKFYCDKVDDSGYGLQVELSAVVSDENLENQDFNEATPNGQLSMQIDNPKAVGFFEVGKEYYLDFTESK